MRNAILGAAGAALIASSVTLSPVAQAADLPVKAIPYASAVPVYSWDGFFVYGSAGFANLNSSQNFGQAISQQLAGLGLLLQMNASTGATPSASTTGFFGGGGVGAQKAYGNFLIGVRLDVDSFGQGTSVNTIVGQINTNSHLFGTGNVRAGFTFGNNWYLYGTGGVAWDHVCIDSGGSSACNSGVGYMLGGGVEYDVPLGWSPTSAFFINAEYRHYQVSGIDANLNVAGSAPAIVNGVVVPGLTASAAASTTISNQDSLDVGMVSAGLKF